MLESPLYITEEERMLAKGNSNTGSEALDLWVRKSVQSRSSKQGPIDVLKRFLEASGLNPDQLVAHWRKNRYDYRLREEFLTEVNETIESYFYKDLEGYSPATRHTNIYRIIGFFKAHKIPIDPDVRERVYIKYHNRDITKEEIRRLLEHSPLKYKVFYLVALESGQRPFTMSRLKYKHIRKDFEANNVPMLIELPAQLLKDTVGDRFSFIGEDAFKILKEYLAPRMPLEDEEPLFIPDSGEKQHLSSITFSKKFGEIVRTLSLSKSGEKGKPAEIRLYSLRKYFRNGLKMDRDYKEFLMGHKSTLGVDTHYISRDREFYRELYRQGYDNLRVYAPEKAETTEKVTELMKQLTKKDKDLEELKKRVDLLTQIVARAVNKEDLGAMEEAWTGFLTDILSQMEGKIPKGYKLVKVEEEESKSKEEE